MFRNYPEIMSAKEAMQALGIGKSLMYSLLNSGEIPAIRVGGKIWRISKKALIEYAKNNAL